MQQHGSIGCIDTDLVSLSLLATDSVEFDAASGPATHVAIHNAVDHIFMVEADLVDRSQAHQSFDFRRSQLVRSDPRRSAVGKHNDGVVIAKRGLLATTGTLNHNPSKGALPNAGVGAEHLKCVRALEIGEPDGGADFISFLQQADSFFPHVDVLRKGRKRSNY